MALGPRPFSDSAKASTLAVGAALAVVGAWTGCSVEKNYELLSFFFDGVPDPNAPMMEGASGPVLRESPTYSAHEPYVQDQCRDCHKARFNLGPQDSDICFDCHENVPTAQPVMHGPVVAGACLWCHSAHESPYPSLLKGTGREVCMTCHEAGMLSVRQVPEHADESISCLSCHYGHGGMSRYFLRDGAESAGGAGVGGGAAPSDAQGGAPM